MYIRRLLSKDAGRMLQWMHTPEIVEHMQVDFASLQMGDCQTFIDRAQDTEHNLHLAIVNDADEYMGTVSLKNIDKALARAEFAIVVSKDAQGKGYANYAMREIMCYGFGQYNLKYIYWNVKKSNKRAIAFYKKMGFKMQSVPCAKLDGLSGSSTEVGWYLVEQGQYKEAMDKNKK